MGATLTETAILGTRTSVAPVIAVFIPITVVEIVANRPASLLTARSHIPSGYQKEALNLC